MLDILKNNATSFFDSGASDIEDLTYYIEASVPENGELVAYTSNTATIPGKIKAPGVALSIGNGKATLNWSKENADGYIVLMDGKPIYDTHSGSVTSYTKTGLTNYEWHGFSVKAYKNINGKTVYGPKSKSVFTREYSTILDSARTNDTRSFSLINRQGATDTTSTVYLSDNDFAIMEKFAKEHFTDEMSDVEKLSTTLFWINENVIYAEGSDWNKISGKSYVDATFSYKLGQCAQKNGAMVSMMRYLGYDADLILGWRGSAQGYKTQHLWGEVEIDGTRYVVETGEGFWYFFLTPYELSDSKYVMNNKNARHQRINDANEQSDFEYEHFLNVRITGYKGKDSAVKIPSELNGEKVAVIDADAFSSRADITSVAIPNSVGIIKNGAFRDCTGLTSMIIPSGIKRIGVSTFSGCTGLKSITLPDSIIEIANNAFYECGSLESITIPNSVKEIGDSAFLRCTALTSVTIPESVTTIEEQAFQDCAGITSVKIPNSITRIEDYVFKGCTGLTDVTIPNSVTSIGSKAFLDCSGLTSVTIPNSVTSMGITAFSGCGLTSVTIPGSITKIEIDAFFGCSSLTSVTIGSGVTSLEPGAFGRCTGLTDVTIPNSVTSIARHAFYNCTSLTDLIIPDGVTKIEEGAFEGCENIQATYKGNTYDYEHINDLYKAING